jgi:hypothetical protein
MEPPVTVDEDGGGGVRRIGSPLPVALQRLPSTTLTKGEPLHDSRSASEDFSDSFGIGTVDPDLHSIEWAPHTPRIPPDLFRRCRRNLRGGLGHPIGESDRIPQAQGPFQKGGGETVSPQKEASEGSRQNTVAPNLKEAIEHDRNERKVGNRTAVDQFGSLRSVEPRASENRATR